MAEAHRPGQGEMHQLCSKSWFEMEKTSDAWDFKVQWENRSIDELSLDFQMPTFHRQGFIRAWDECVSCLNLNTFEVNNMFSSSVLL